MNTWVRFGGFADGLQMVFLGLAWFVSGDWFDFFGLA